jgi:hypothetical protein
MKQKIQAKNYAVFCFAGKRKLLFLQIVPNLWVLIVLVVHPGFHGLTLLYGRLLSMPQYPNTMEVYVEQAIPAQYPNTMELYDKDGDVTKFKVENGAAAGAAAGSTSLSSFKKASRSSFAFLSSSLLLISAPSTFARSVWAFM